MKEKFTEIKNKAIELCKGNKMVPAVAIFSVVSLVLILVAMLLLNEFVVSVCVLIILEAGMAALLHKVELWKHGVLLAAQFVAGLIIGRIPLVVVCMIAYVAATVALQFMVKGETVSPEA